MATAAAQMTPEAVLAITGLQGDVPMTAAQTSHLISVVITQCGQEFQAQNATVQEATAAIAALRDNVDASLLHNAKVNDGQIEKLDFKFVEVDADVKESLAKVALNISQVEALKTEFHNLYSTCEVSFAQNTAQATERVLEIQRQVQSLV